MSKKISAISFCTMILLASAGSLSAKPIDLYRVELAKDSRAYSIAARYDWPVYFIQDNVLLVSRDLNKSEAPEVVSSKHIFSGDTRQLSWVVRKKTTDYYVPVIAALFEGNGSALMLTQDIPALLAKSPGLAFKVNSFKSDPITYYSQLTISNPKMDKDPDIQAIADQIDTGQVRAWVLGLESFATRYVKASNHWTVANWIMQEFINMGISDVHLDTFLIYPWWGGGAVECYNVVATIPGTLDTSVSYIVGGHWDSVVWDNVPPDDPSLINAPGSDDNASGTVAAMEMARILVSNPPKYTVRFIAMDAEETGLEGARTYADSARAHDENIGLMLNYDMIGSYQDASGNINDSIFGCKLYSGSEEYAYLLGQMATWYGRLADTNLVPSYNTVYLDGSDSWEFWDKGYPVTYSEEYRFSDRWHLISDSITHMNIRYCTSVIKAGLGLLATMSNYPKKVENVTVSDLGIGTDLKVQWTPNMALNTAGYNIYYGSSSGVYTGSQYTTNSEDTITGLTPNVKCYVIVRAVDSDGKESPVATEAEGMSVLLTLDQGILIVDETQNWTTGSFPRDTTQDQYYDSLLAGYTATKYEFGSSGQKPALSNMAAYSTIFWHSDDYSQTLMNPCIEDLKLYLGNGGQLVMAGWKPTADITSSTIDTMHYSSGSFMYDYMKVSQMNRSLSADSFQGAVGKLGYPDIAVDPVKVPVASYGGTMRYAENLVPVSPAEGIYDIDMKNNGSLFEGLNCGVRYLGSDFKTALLGFPLYFMDQAQARVVVQKILDDFGEVNGVSGKPDNIILGHEFKLFQNAPNPFSKSTAISYHLPKTGKVSLNIYNINGQLVKTLVNSDQPAGRYTANWDRRDNQNKQVSAGVYIYRLSAGNQTLSKKLIVLK